jgi:hypothetical protein
LFITIFIQATGPSKGAPLIINHKDAEVTPHVPKSFSPLDDKTDKIT